MNFGEDHLSTNDSSWDLIIFNSAKSEVRSGLKEELHQNYLSKYDLKGDFICLGPPKVNKELISALSKRLSVLKRDEYQMISQQQVGAYLNALGSGISDLIKFRQNFPTDDTLKTIVIKLAEGIYVLAEHQYRLPVARQAFIKPYLICGQICSRSTIDDWFFGSNFTEDLKCAQACKKAGRKLSKSILSPATNTPYHPVRQLPVQQNPVQRSGNFRDPVQRTLPSACQSEAMHKMSRNRIFRFRS